MNSKHCKRQSKLLRNQFDFSKFICPTRVIIFNFPVPYKIAHFAEQKTYTLTLKLRLRGTSNYGWVGTILGHELKINDH